LLLVLLAWVPIPLGSNRPWSWALMELGAFGLLGGWLVLRALSREPAARAPRGSRPVLGLLVLWVGYMALQTLPLPPAFVQVLSPVAARGLETVEMLPGGVPWTLSVDREATLQAFLKSAACVALFAATLHLAGGRRRLRLVLQVMALSGFGNALYGMVAHFTADWSGLWHPGTIAGTVTGTYVNRNHFAGLMEMSIAVAAGLALSRVGSLGPPRSLREFVDDLSRFALRGGSIVFFVLVMCSALLMSTSRGGVIALIVAVGLVALLGRILHGRNTREARLVPLVALCALIGIMWFGVAGLSGRLAEEGLTSNRLDVWRVSIEVLGESPLLGTGAGTFRWVLPRHKGAGLGDRYYDHAHNDYLESLVETGIVGTGLLGAAVVLALGAMVAGLRRRRDPLARGAVAGALVGTVALVFHGLVDFNFQIPANAAWWFVLLGIGLLAAELPGANESRAPRSRAPREGRGAVQRS
jgi:O-antigen ligase